MSTLTQTTVADDEGLPEPQRTQAVAAIFAALVLVVLDGAIANVALPTIASTLHVSPAASVWVVTGYQLALVMALLPCAALGESLGHRRVFIGGVVVFTVASALCSLSPSLPWLVAARFIQGLGGACLMALAVALLRFT
jgi:DHA2 family multidrug resistance protein-like MFS transporter